MKKKSIQIACRLGGLTLLAALTLFMNHLATAPDKETSLVPDAGTEFLEVHFIDVGQGDSILVETKEDSMLIDAGENNMGTTVVNYLESQNIKKLKYVIGTHPHSDHIGGLDYVINSIPIERIIMPEVAHTTNTYEDVLNAIEKQGMTITKPKVGDRYQLGPAAFTIIAPNNTEYSELNNYSIGIKLTYADTSFLLAGDAEELSEKEMLSNGFDLSADVLKISHHGSDYSTSLDFLNAVKPSYAVISVGKDNDYGHPAESTLKLLNSRGIKIYRTDEQHTVVFTSDGKTLSANTEPYQITDNIH